MIDKNTRLKMACMLGVSFRDRYDFSVDTQYDDWAAMCFKAVTALETKSDAIEAEHVAKIQAEHDAARAAADAIMAKIAKRDAENAAAAAGVSVGGDA